MPGVGRTLFCHATPRNDVECSTRVTPESQLTSVFAGVDADVVVCGHTHMQFDRCVAERRIVNAGSVGMPFAGPSGAYWLLLAAGVQPRRTDYDVDAAAAQLRGSGFPHVEALAVRYVLNPPSEDESWRFSLPSLPRDLAQVHHHARALALRSGNDRAAGGGQGRREDASPENALGDGSSELQGKIREETWNQWDVEFVEKMILEFDAVDLSGFRFRYHGETFGTHDPLRDVLRVNELHIRYNVLFGQMDHVRRVLGLIDTYFYETHGMIAEWEAEMRADMDSW